LSILALLPSSGACATAPEPWLRPSEQLDTRRLGKVSEDERAVLRIEWRAAATGAEEAHSVQQMLDSLRRMEGTVGDLGRLLRSMPAQRPATTVEPSAPEVDDKILALGGTAAAALLALFWFTRRKPVVRPEAEALVGPAPIPGPPEPVPPVEPPAQAPLARDLAAGQPQAAAPDAPAPCQPATGAAVDAGADVRRIETRSMAEVGGATQPPLAASVTPAEPTKPPREHAESTAAQSAEIPPIEFSLEDADPEAVARENRRLLKLQAMSPPGASAPQRESHVEPTLELAEIMLSMGLEQSAAQALVEFSEANPRQALYHWLKLLDIYRNTGHRKDFKETAEKLRQHFNIQAEDWTKTRTGAVPTLEDFSRVAGHVQEVWSQPEQCIAYLRHLLEDNREGSRAGFPQPVAEEILLLIEILKLDPAMAQAAGT
jgi:hypothetical protein